MNVFKTQWFDMFELSVAGWQDKKKLVAVVVNFVLKLDLKMSSNTNNSIVATSLFSA